LSQYCQCKVPESNGFIFIYEDTGKTYKETG
jgi:hypothetical protein